MTGETDIKHGLHQQPGKRRGMGSMTIGTTFSNDSCLVNMATTLNDLSYVIVTIITEFWLILVNNHGVIASVGVMTLLAIILDYRFVEMPHFHQCIKFPLVTKKTKVVSLTNEKFIVPRGMVFMTEDASPLFCRGMEVFFTMKFFSLLMAGKTEFLTWVCFDQERKFRAMGVMALETLSFSNRFMDKILQLHFMAEGTKFFSSGNQLEEMLIFHR